MIATFLGIIAGKVFDELAGKGLNMAANTAIARLQGDKVKAAFKLALGEAVQRYATSGTRFAIAEPLLRADGPLANDTVANELAQVLRFDREPNYQLIGDRWKAEIVEPPAWRDFTFEAQTLIRYIKEELQASEVFRPVFEEKALSAINENAATAGEVLGNIEDQIVELRHMMDSHFGELMWSFAGGWMDIHTQIRDFSWYIQEKTRDFIGRRYVFDQVEAFIQENPRGYFIIKGDPGIGKTALAAQWVKNQGCAHHFISRPLGINRSESFLRNICSQLLSAYHLSYTFLPPEAVQDGGFLIRILNDISESLKPGEKAVIVVDALDEVEEIKNPQSPNILFLPTSLPKGIYILATSRRTELPLRIECEHQDLLIEQDSKMNIADIRAYVEGKSARPGIEAYISAQEIDRELFVEHLVDKSQGNFMYLRYVLPEIERGIYKDLALDTVPAGLENYYEDHWRRMRGDNEQAWLEYKLPVVIALTIVKEPVSIDRLAVYSKVKEKSKIYTVLHEWQQFLYERKVEYEGGLQKRWRVYHDSFREFIAAKDEVEGEHVILKEAHLLIAEAMRAEIFGSSR